MALATEPYPGYFTSDPIWDAQMCAELYTTVGPVARNHFHPVEDGGGGTPAYPSNTLYPSTTLFPWE